MKQAQIISSIVAALACAALGLHGDAQAIERAAMNHLANDRPRCVSPLNLIQFSEIRTNFTDSSNDFSPTSSVDIDGDGDLDLLALRYPHTSSVPYPEEVLLYRNDGAGNFDLANSIDADGPYGQYHWATAFTAFDANLDGSADIVTAFVPGNFAPESARAFVTLALQNADGTGFQFFDIITHLDPAVPGSNSSFYPTQIDRADLDGDGLADLVVTLNQYVWPFADVHGIIAVIKNLGGGQFSSPIYIQAGFRPNFLRLADMNNDGRIDIITMDHAQLETPSLPASNVPKVVNVYLNLGGLAFQRSSFPVTLAAPARATGMDVGDLDGNGTADVAASFAQWPEVSSSPDLVIFRNAGSGSLVQAASLLTEDARQDRDRYATTLRIADIDQDGRAEIAVGTSFGEVIVFRNSPLGSYSATHMISRTGGDANLGNYAIGLELGNFSGSSALDVAIVGSTTIALSESVVTPAPQCPSTPSGWEW